MDEPDRRNIAIVQRMYEGDPSAYLAGHIYTRRQ
jgi:hypothetical protein